MHDVLNKNCGSYRHVGINFELLMGALSKDEKNSATQLRLILPGKEGRIGIGLYNNNNDLQQAIRLYFKEYGGEL